MIDDTVTTTKGHTGRGDDAVTTTDGDTGRKEYAIFKSTIDGDTDRGDAVKQEEDDTGRSGRREYATVTTTDVDTDRGDDAI